MSSGIVDSKDGFDKELHESKNDHDGVEFKELEEEKIDRRSSVLVDKDLMTDAMHGENREHQMGVWEAVKLYPMACMWAFIMCFTIVSLAEDFDENAN